MQYSRVMSVPHQVLIFTLAIGLELAVANNISNQTDFTVPRGIPRFSRLVYGLSVTGVVATLLVIVALAGGVIRAKMERSKELEKV